MRFADFAGNAGVKALLASQSLSHAYILSGPAGTGKRTLARLMAAAMVCAEPGEAPCLRCISCRKAMNGTHPDISEIHNDGKGIYVDQVRALRAGAFIRPNEAERKVYLIRDTEEMNSSAQNALLRLLEEGPQYAAFLLLTKQASALLPTVRSRCIELQLSPVSEKEAFRWLSQRYPGREEPELRKISVRCEGVLGRATAELEPAEPGTGTDSLARAREFISALTGGSELALMEFAVSLEKCGRDEMASFLDAAALLLRDGLLYTMGLAPNAEQTRAAAAEEIANHLTKQEIMGTIEIIEGLRKQCNYNLGAGHCAGRLAAACWEGIH